MTLSYAGVKDGNPVYKAAFKIKTKSNEIDSGTWPITLHKKK